MDDPYHTILKQTAKSRRERIRRMLKTMTLEQAAAIEGVSRQRIHQLVRAVDKDKKQA